MYGNVGKTIKLLIKVGVIILFILSTIAGIVAFIINAEENLFLAIAELIFISLAGGLLAWFSGLLMYAYGEIADRLISIESLLKAHSSHNESSESVVGAVPVCQCKSCGRINNAGANFCISCGNALDGQ